MTKLITVTDMLRSFSEIIGCVYYKGETYDIKKGNNIVARLSPAKFKATTKITELNNLFKTMPEYRTEDSEDFRNILKEIRSVKDKDGIDKWE